MPHLHLDLDSLFRQSLPDDVLHCHEEIQSAADEFVEAIKQFAPDSVERTSALQKIREATEQVKAAISGIEQTAAVNAIVQTIGNDLWQSDEEMKEISERREEEIQASITTALVAPL